MADTVSDNAVVLNDDDMECADDDAVTFPEPREGYEQACEDDQIAECMAFAECDYTVCRYCVSSAHWNS